MSNLETEIKVLSERVENWMSTTTEYRKLLCDKIDKINTKVELLPCKERGEMYKNAKFTTKLLWGALGITFGILIAHLGWK
jgi:hypothetical protein